MLRGIGERRDECLSLSSCLANAGRENWQAAHCPAVCGAFEPSERWQRHAVHFDGSGSSPLAEAQDGGEDVDVDARGISTPKSEAKAAIVLEELARSGPASAASVAAACGISQNAITRKYMPSLVSRGLVERVGYFLWKAVGEP